MQHYIIPTSLPRSERLFARLLHSLLCTLVLNALHHSCRVGPGGGGANRYELGMELDCDPRLLLCCLMRVRQPFYQKVMEEKTKKNCETCVPPHVLAPFTEVSCSDIRIHIFHQVPFSSFFFVLDTIFLFTCWKRNGI